MVALGQTIGGKYRLLRLLGDGGMGSVYEAEHLALGTRVAIKVLHPELTRRAGLMERFLQEARVSAQIRSPHVVQVTDVDRTQDGDAYLVMELLEGEPLSKVLDREQKLSAGTAREYTRQILIALEAAHALGVVHRDLKPDNVFITFVAGRPVVKLIDFGIAKLKQEGGAAKNLTVAGMLMGTPEYMAPEQAYAAEKVDARADIYAVGVMLYEMLAGRTPASGADPRIVVGKVERGEITPLVHAEPGTAPELAGAVHRAMAPRLELRFASATEMRLALEAIDKKSGTAELAAKAQTPIGEASTMPEAAGGTVMGAPVEAVLLAGPAAGGTMSGAPLGQGGGPPPGAGPGMHGPTGTGPPPPPQVMMAGSGPPPPVMAPSPARRGGGRSSGGSTGLVVGLGALALLLGAGAVVAYVYSTSSTSTPPPPPTFPTTTPPPTVTTPPTVATTDPTGLGTATPLTPPSPTAVTPPPATRPPGSVRPPATRPDAGAPPPPLVFPSGLPSGFPPIPSGFPPMPTELPSLNWPLPPPPPPR